MNPLQSPADLVPVRVRVKVRVRVRVRVRVSGRVCCNRRT